MKSLNGVEICVFILTAGLPQILFAILTVLLWRRLIKKIKWVYNDWLIIFWLIVSIIALILSIIYFIWSLFNFSFLSQFGFISYVLMWVFIDMFEILNTVYSVILIVYYSKLSDLKKNKKVDKNFTRKNTNSKFSINVFCSEFFVFTRIICIQFKR